MIQEFQIMRFYQGGDAENFTKLQPNIVFDYIYDHETGGETKLHHSKEHLYCIVILVILYKENSLKQLKN